MKLLIVLAFVIGVTFATLDDDWALWKSQYSKSYEDEASESVRRIVWEDNWHFVQQHNSEGRSFEVEMNEYADLVSDAAKSKKSFIAQCFKIACSSTVLSVGQLILLNPSAWSRIEFVITDHHRVTR